jgi:hypothetical protein
LKTKPNPLATLDWLERSKLIRTLSQTHPKTKFIILPVLFQGLILTFAEIYAKAAGDKN